ncbi:DUF421 domain-containing protein [uncultured Clostridium sp.]|uniref:DUF421 domain-containing protein n=1 Tax=uncultured Clostridium sp. TaxID=59620 RepID=UPI0032177AE5
MFILIIRTVILYVYLIFIMRVMGKRQLGQLEPVDFVVALMISELATLPMGDNRIPLIYAIVPITTLVFLQVMTSFLELKSEHIRSILNGQPSILIKDGLVNVKELKQVRYNLDDLLGELRQNGYFNLQEIHYAILETDGSLSIVPYTAYEPPTREDFKIKVEDEPLPMPVILDGVINKVNLKAIGKDNYWLEENLSNNNIKSYKDVLIAIVYSNTHKFYFQLKNETTNASDNEKES